jgi:hypothetical protein
MCPKKGHFIKMGIAIQKMSHLNVHLPLDPIPKLNIPSYDLMIVFKILKTLGDKTFHYLSHQCCTQLLKIFCHVGQLAKIII